MSALPIFLTGALAVFLQADLGFGALKLGLAVAAFFAAAAAAAIPGGRVTERVGARRAIAWAALAGAVAMLGIALLAHNWTALLLWLLLAGAASGIAEPAGNLALSRGVDLGRQGLAFGLKQSSIPTASLLAGAAVPALAVTVGWEWAFLVGVLCALSLLALLPADPYVMPPQLQGRRYLRDDIDGGLLLTLALASACGAAAASSLIAFYVLSAVEAGVDVGAAGGLLVFGSISVVFARLSLGWWSDRCAAGHLGLITVLLLLGVAGYVGMSLTLTTPFLLVPATLLTFAAGWAWPGLFNHLVVRLNPGAPAAATSVTQTGVYVGGIIGPAGFGIVVEVASLPMAWMLAGGLNAAAAAALLLAGRRLAGP